jgi:hypothetical protein
MIGASKLYCLSCTVNGTSSIACRAYQLSIGPMDDFFPWKKPINLCPLILTYMRGRVQHSTLRILKRKVFGHHISSPQPVVFNWWAIFSEF